jgi:hypothetical protein
MPIHPGEATMGEVIPGEVELQGRFRRHLGPRITAAGLRIQFHRNQVPGIHFKVEPESEYRPDIERGLRDGMEARFPGVIGSWSIWVIGIEEHEVDSSPQAFYRVSRMLVEQAYFLARPDADARS